jgi:outer membrane protein OmpA-like peptidoglycan-associated protein
MTKHTLQSVAALVLGVTVVGISGCAPYQSVQGAYATPNKRVGAMATGATVGGGILSGGSGIALAGATGAGAGFLTTHAKTSLQETLAKQGVNVIAQGETLRLVLSSDQFFYQGSPALRPKQYPVLTNVAALLKEYGKVPITISGYTDSIGSPKENYILSQQQAESMRAYFWVHGIEHQHVKVIGYGAQYPVAENRGKGYAANRRIEITLKSF